MHSTQQASNCHSHDWNQSRLMRGVGTQASGLTFLRQRLSMRLLQERTLRQREVNYQAQVRPTVRLRFEPRPSGSRALGSHALPCVALAEGPHLFRGHLKAHPLQEAFLTRSSATPSPFHHEPLLGSRTSSRRERLTCCFCEPLKLQDGLGVNCKSLFFRINRQRGSQQVGIGVGVEGWTWRRESALQCARPALYRRGG